MVDWVEVYKRLLQVYNVRTQAQLGMAMGVPGSIAGEDVEQTGISWKILDLAVTQKELSWDWLLVGKGESPQPAPDPDAEATDAQQNTQTEADTAANARPLHMETRELARELLDDNAARSRSATRELEDIRSNMQKEIEKVDDLLGGNDR